MLFWVWPLIFRIWLISKFECFIIHHKLAEWNRIEAVDIHACIKKQWIGLDERPSGFFLVVMDMTEDAIPALMHMRPRKKRTRLFQFRIRALSISETESNGLLQNLMMPSCPRCRSAVKYVMFVLYMVSTSCCYRPIHNVLSPYMDFTHNGYHPYMDFIIYGYIDVMGISTLPANRTSLRRIPTCLNQHGGSSQNNINHLSPAG